MKERFLALMARLEQGRLAPLVQFIKFGMVGVSNTLISYAVEMLCYYLLFSGLVDTRARAVIANVIAFVISVTNAYYWNNRYVFKGGKRTILQHLWAYLKTAACYALTGLLLAPAMKLWLSGIGVPYWIASLSTLLVTIPLNFLMNKFWAFRK